MIDHNFYSRELPRKWFSLWANFSVDAFQKDQLLMQLVNFYTQTNRFYHNLNHIGRMLTKIEAVKFLAINFPAIQLATWFHDCIYDPSQRDNEEKSANFAQEKLTDLGLEIELINQVKNLILMTKNHQSLNHDIDSQILLDGDLEILGASPRNYHNYALAIRHEYAWLSPEIYSQKRKAILESFLAKARIYQTDFFFNQLESQARINLQQEIMML